MFFRKIKNIRHEKQCDQAYTVKYIKKSWCITTDTPQSCSYVGKPSVTLKCRINNRLYRSVIQGPPDFLLVRQNFHWSWSDPGRGFKFSAGPVPKFQFFACWSWLALKRAGPRFLIDFGSDPSRSRFPNFSSPRFPIFSGLGPSFSSWTS